jgi:excisionase family DNA binding protein
MPAPDTLPWERTAAKESPRFVTMDEVATYLNISKWMVYAQINQKKLKTVTIGSRRLVTPEDLQAYVNQLRAEQGGFRE